jgi:ABC-type phosphate/phosphonate transport system substrate-binding protein
MAKGRAKPAAVAAKADTPSLHAQLPPEKPPQPAVQAAPKQLENTAAQASAAPPPKTVQEQVAAASAGTAPARADPDALVAVVLARLDVKSVADLKAKVVAIDDRYSSSNTNVRTAIVAAGAPEVQLSEGQGTAINRLVNGEVPAAVVDVERAEAAELFPEIAGYRVFHIPLSPGSTKAKP